MTLRHAASRTGALLALLAVALPAGGQSCGAGASDAAAAEIVTFKAVGDIVLGSDWPKASYPPDFEAQTRDRLRRTLGEADVVFGNFEGALTTHSISTKKPGGGTVFAFRMPPRFAALLRESGFSVLHISNNHTYDFGETGFADTLSHLASAGILPVGEKDRITLQMVRGISIAWVGFSYSARHNDMHDHAKLGELVRAARVQADLVVVSVQAGAEGAGALRVVDRDELFLGESRGNVYAFARHAVDLGADFVLGHGPHVVRGLECYRDKVIAYSLGNFVGYNALSIKGPAAVSMVLEVRLTKNRQTAGVKVIPVRFAPDRLPDVDDDGLALYLLNDLSRLHPLTGSLTLPVTTEGQEKYRNWLSAAGLARVVSEK